MADSIENPSVSGYLSEVFDGWSSRVSGILSIPLTVASLLSTAGPFQGQWWTSGKAAVAWIVSATVAWIWTGYAVWAKERSRVIGLHGRPAVVVNVRSVGVETNPEHLIGVANASDDVAVNITMSPVRISDNTTMEFKPISSLPKGLASTWLEYRFVGLGADVYSQNTLYRTFKISKIEAFTTKLSFSNFGNSVRWDMVCEFAWDFDAKSLLCRLGACQRATHGVS